MADVAAAFDVILHKGVVGETYNIGTQKVHLPARLRAPLTEHVLPHHDPGLAAWGDAHVAAALACDLYFIGGYSSSEGSPLAVSMTMKGSLPVALCPIILANCCVDRSER